MFLLMLGEGKMNIIRKCESFGPCCYEEYIGAAKLFQCAVALRLFVASPFHTRILKDSVRQYLASATQTSIIYTLHENGGSTNRISSTKEVNPITRKSAHVIISNTAKCQSVHPSLTAIRAFVSYYSGLYIQNLLFCVCLTNSSETWLYY